jgi:hypothetical protein
MADTNTDANANVTNIIDLLHELDAWLTPG